MKKLIIASSVIILLSFKVNAQNPNDSIILQTIPLQVVEASCGQCQFDLPGKGCNLAVRIKDKAYFVDGTSIDDHGDAHASDGFCAAIRKATVEGEITNNRFKAKSFKLLPLKGEEK